MGLMVELQAHCFPPFQMGVQGLGGKSELSL